MDKKKIVKEIIKKKPTILEDLIGIKNKKLIDELTLEKKKDPEVKATHNDAYGYPGKRGQMDILYLPNDKGFKYLLVAVDNYTKKTDAIPLRYRTAEAVRKAIDKIYFENKILEPPIILQVDAGSEFKKGLDEYLKKKNIHLRRASVARHSQQANVEARNKSIGSLIMKSQLVKELENNKVSKEWLKLLPKILKKINDNAKPKKMKQTGDVPCMKNGDCNLYEINDMVRYKLDYPVNYKGKKQVGKFREGDIRYSIKPHKIENILLLPDRPVRYILEGIKDKTFSKNQLKPVENEIVKKIVAKKAIKPKKKWVDEPIEILTGKRNRKKVNRGVFIGNGLNFPYKKISLNDAKEDFKKLINLDVSKYKYSLYGNKTTDYYFQKIRANVKTGKWSQYTFFKYNKEKLIKNCMKLKKKLKNELTDSDLRGCLDLNSSSNNQFRPSIAKYMYNKFKATKILDPCAGYGGRCLGALSLNLKYTGIDPNKKLIKPFKNLLKTFDKNNNAKIINDYAENVDYSKIDYDFVFTSPPYWNIEKYDDMKNYNNFIDDFLLNVYVKVYKYLPKNKYIGLNIPIKMYEEFIKKVGKADIRIPYLKNTRPGPGKKYVEYIYFWRKK